MREKGVEISEYWIATLDGFTRHSHRMLHGEEKDYETGEYSNGCRYPADPFGKPAEVYNCRCTMVGDVKKYPAKYKRYNNEKGKPIQYMTYDQWAKFKSYGKSGYVASQGGKGKQVNQKAELKQAQDDLAKLKQEIADKGADKVFEDIWYNQTVTYADYEAKKDSIAAKKQYYQDQITKYTAEKNWAMVAKMQNKLDDVIEFETHGAEYSALLKKMEEAKKHVSGLTPKPTLGNGVYTQERKDAAKWAKSPQEADNNLRSISGEVWRNATDAERRAIWDYTGSYSKFNEPLRGWEYGASNYATGSGFKGVGNTDLNAGYANNGKNLNAMTSIISKSTYSDDIWLQRGCKFGGMDKFLNCPMDLLKNRDQEEVQEALLGTVVTEYGFMSCGSSKGKGFTGNIMLNIFAPAGTKMMYVEPFSQFGNGSGLKWDGKSSQHSFGSELETILQQNTQFRIVKVEVTDNNKIYIDLDVIAQNEPQLWKKTP